MSETPHLTPQQIIDLYSAAFGPGLKAQPPQASDTETDGYPIPALCGNCRQ
jgi:hypothetical protein